MGREDRHKKDEKDQKSKEAKRSRSRKDSKKEKDKSRERDAHELKDAAEGLVMKCPKGHSLKAWTSPMSGICDGCKGEVDKREEVLDCRACDWYLCARCSRKKISEIRKKDQETTAQREAVFAAARKKAEDEERHENLKTQISSLEKEEVDSLVFEKELEAKILAIEQRENTLLEENAKRVGEVENEITKMKNEAEAASSGGGIADTIELDTAQDETLAAEEAALAKELETVQEDIEAEMRRHRDKMAELRPREEDHKKQLQAKQSQRLASQKKREEEAQKKDEKCATLWKNVEQKKQQLERLQQEVIESKKDADQ